MRVLFYGGCHAQVLCDIFRTFGTRDDVSYDQLVNFKLIAKQDWFPYDDVAAFDLVVFSPILNRAQFNTSHLVEFCRARGIATLSYPWLEWRGYFPGIRKDDTFFGCKQWNYRALHALALESTCMERFRAACLEDASALGAEPDGDAETRELALREQNSGAEIEVAPFVAENYRRARLFLTPDHPTGVLYAYVARRIAEATGLALRAGFDADGFEPQLGIKVPIFPAVARRLALDFSDSSYQNAEIFGRAVVIPLSEYLECVFQAAHRRQLFVAKTVTFVKTEKAYSGNLTQGEKIAARVGDRLLGRIAEDRDNHFRIETTATQGGLPVQSRDYFIFKPAWRVVGHAE